MDWKREGKWAAALVAVFLAVYFLPTDWPRLLPAVGEALALAREYARAHVLLCLVPALGIAGGIAALVRQGSVLRYLGVKAPKVLAYGVASVAGSVLAVCSCTVLPLFAGIWRMGAGLGPATALLYSGPAINVLAIILTARVLGWELGVARAVGAVAFSVVIGLAMHFIFRKEERARADVAAAPSAEAGAARPLWKTALLFGVMVAILVFANWARSGDVRAVFLCCPDGLSTYRVEGSVVEETAEAVTVRDASGGEHRIPRGQLTALEPVAPSRAYQAIYRARWLVVAAALAALALMVRGWVSAEEGRAWGGATWGLAKQMLPLLLAGILVSGLLLGRPGHEGLIPGRYVEMLVGASPDVFLRATGLGGGGAEGLVRATWPLWANLAASVAGALMYFATLTEVPIVQGLIGSGMGKGPALALLLAGPALSLPNMLVIRSILGTRKTLVYVALVVTMATVSGMAYGAVF